MVYEEKEFEGVLFNSEGLFFRRGKWKNGSDNGHGYKLVEIKYKKFRVHRVIATLFITNDNPELTQVDHISGDRSDNRVENLRWVNARMNHNNRKDQSKYGVSIYFNEKLKKPFRVQIMKNGKTEYFGYHKTIEEAEAERDQVYISQGWELPTYYYSKTSQNQLD